MDRCDVLIVGGGPAGSSCAWALRHAGLDVVVMDKAVFPRDKVCAGWITPAVIDALEFDIEAYRQDHVFQNITGFSVGLHQGPMIEIHHDSPVSFGIRRCEFDDYLLRRSGARLRLGESVHQLVRTSEGWVVNDILRAPVIVGAGGHFCPVARFLGADVGHTECAVKAQECEIEIPLAQGSSCAVRAEIPELYFCEDLKGYGWCVRKGDVINIGLGREDSPGLAQQVEAFHAFLLGTGRIAPDLELRFKGHAYLLYPRSTRPLVDEGVLLIGDAAGLAYAQSGEGIRPAIESGLLAAATLLAAHGKYDREALGMYQERLLHRLGPRGEPDRGRWLPAGLRARLAGLALSNPWFVRNVVLDRWFLHCHEPPLRLS